MNFKIFADSNSLDKNTLDIFYYTLYFVKSQSFAISDKSEQNLCSFSIAARAGVQTFEPERLCCQSETKGEEGLLVTYYRTDNFAQDGELFKIKVRSKTPGQPLKTAIQIRSADNNMCDRTPKDVPAQYEAGYILSEGYAIVNEKLENGTFTCEAYFDSADEAQPTVAILAFYDEIRCSSHRLAALSKTILRNHPIANPAIW